MYSFININGLIMPSYGAMVVLGIVISNLFGYIVLKKNNLDLNDFIIIESQMAIGALLGSKILYLLIFRKEINWIHIFNLNYFSTIMGSGFVFYGGLIGSFIAITSVPKLYGIDYRKYIKYLCFMIPMFHAFGRMGCFLSGCCYGIPYQGILSVTFPVGSLAPSNIALFPVQILEAIVLIIISLFVYLISKRKQANWNTPCYLYFFLYSISRFVIEEFRYDESRGIFCGFSTSQWISILIIFMISIILSVEKNRG
ncbi:MAG: prolipoprotein diacylglyceryl transferase [Tissierellia bacterium]|nr:prolipoprotein diacylglyceryl transferase [Tissierellia bacterium]